MDSVRQTDGTYKTTFTLANGGTVNQWTTESGTVLKMEGLAPNGEHDVRTADEHKLGAKVPDLIKQLLDPASFPTKLFGNLKVQDGMVVSGAMSNHDSNGMYGGCDTKVTRSNLYRGDVLSGSVEFKNTAEGTVVHGRAMDIPGETGTILNADNRTGPNQFDVQRIDIAPAGDGKYTVTYTEAGSGTKHVRTVGPDGVQNVVQ